MLSDINTSFLSLSSIIHLSTKVKYEVIYDNRGTALDAPPIRRLPPELLIEIFLLAIPPRSFHTKLSRVVPDYPPYRISHALSQTCRHWRNIALSTPDLWTTIPTIRDMDVDPVKGFVSHVALFLERSGNSPLHIVISTPRSAKAKGEEVHEGAGFCPILLYLLLTQCYRWKTAVMHIHHQQFERIPNFSLPILEKLNVRCCNGDFLPVHLIGFPHRVFGSTPALKHLVMDGQHSHPRIGNMCSTLLTYIGLPRNLDDLSSSCSCLSEVVLRGPLSTMRLPNTVLHFEKLKMLKLSNINYTYPEQRFGGERETAFKWINAPNLESLEVEGHPTIDNSAMIVKDILSTTLPSSSSSRLQSLTLHIFGLTKVDLCQLLKATPRLTKLDLRDCPADYFEPLVFLSDETTGNPREPLASLLCSLTLRNFSGDFGLLKKNYSSRQGSLTIDCVYTSPKLCWQAQNRAEGWKVMESRLHPRGSEYIRLLGWSTYLAKQFLARMPGAAEKFILTGKASKRLRNLHNDSASLDAFFKVVESYQVQETNLDLLELTRIRRVMTAITSLPGHVLPDEVRYTFRERARQIARKWEELRDQHDRTRSEWILSGNGTTLTLRPRDNLT